MNTSYQERSYVEDGFSYLRKSVCDWAQHKKDNSSNFIGKRLAPFAACCICEASPYLEHPLITIESVVFGIYYALRSIKDRNYKNLALYSWKNLTEHGLRPETLLIVAGSVCPYLFLLYLGVSLVRAVLKEALKLPQRGITQSDGLID